MGRPLNPAALLPCAKSGRLCSASISLTLSLSTWRTSLSLDSCSPLPECSAPPRSPPHENRRLYRQRVSVFARALRDGRNHATAAQRGASNLLQWEARLAEQSQPGGTRFLERNTLFSAALRRRADTGGRPARLRSSQPLATGAPRDLGARSVAGPPRSCVGSHADGRGTRRTTGSAGRSTYPRSSRILRIMDGLSRSSARAS